MLSIRYLSDLHLEFIRPHKINKFIELIRPAAPDQICVLAGDIGNPFSSNYDALMKHMDKSFRRTFVVAGNHEYYNKKKSMRETREHMKSYFAQYDNISFLDNSSEVYDGRLFVGTTLWSKITPSRGGVNPINDILCIPDFDSRAYNRYHACSRLFLEKTVETSPSIASEPQIPVVVITHHVPSFDFMAEKYRTCLSNEWFYCDMNDFIYRNRGRICAWFYGHTHTASVCNLHGVPFYCNPIGYIGENPGADFSATAAV
jgi:predicted MPP superfamily phosphohydrolase